jgi:hypothetical protein
MIDGFPTPKHLLAKHSGKVADGLEFAVSQRQAEFVLEVAFGCAARWRFETTEFATMQTLSQSLFFLLPVDRLKRRVALLPVVWKFFHQIAAGSA